jgi:exportin-T
MMKMKYDEDTEWSDESDEPEEEALFMEMRKVGYFAFICSS